MDDNIRVVRLTQDYEFKSFDCGNQDLNDFLLSDSKAYLKKLLCVTYILETDDDIVAYFSVSNDKISVPDSDKATWIKTYPCRVMTCYRSATKKPMPMKRKILRITEKDYIKANRKASREEEIEAHGKQISFRHVLHRSRKKYDRKRLGKPGMEE